MLSPDGEEVLQDLDPTMVYCIGGIVDRTTKKNLTKGWAVSLLGSAPLPGMQTPCTSAASVPESAGTALRTAAASL